MKTGTVYILLWGLCCGLLCASQSTAQTFRLMRYDENYGHLHSDTAGGFYSKLKYRPLSDNKKWYLSFGGEARAEYDAFNNEDWGRAGTGKNNFWLQRYDLHADLHMGNDIRLFIQLRSALQNGRKNGPRPIDQDQLNIQNLFADFTINKHKTDSLILRVGRQELNYGAGRIISVREGPNVRLYFTGAKVAYNSTSLLLDAFAMEADDVSPYVFDNRPSKQLNLWGLYGSADAGSGKHLDAYYIGNRNDNRVYDQGAGKEIRHTFGGRLWKNDRYFVYDIEAAYQTGTFNGEPLRAWTLSLDVGYIFSDLTARPAIGLRNDYISGDRNRNDGRLETFNPIYPKGGYFGFDPQVGPVNLIDIHPYGSVILAPRVTLLLDAVFNWRYSLNDGVYRPSGVFNFSGSGSRKRFIGVGYLGKISYTVSPFIAMDFGIQYFSTGPFIETALVTAKNALYTNSRISFKF